MPEPEKMTPEEMKPVAGESARDYIYRFYAYAGHVVQGYWCRQCWALVHEGRRVEHHQSAHMRF